MYLVAPDTGFFGDKVIKSILHLWICWNEKQQIPHTKRDPGGRKKETNAVTMQNNLLKRVFKKSARVPGLIQISQLVKHFKHITHQSHDHTRKRLLLNTKTWAACELMGAWVCILV